MKRDVVLFMLVLLPLSIAAAQDTSEIKDEMAIKRTALDYAEGYYDGSGERMERAIHADLNKVFAVTLSETGKTMLRYSTVSQLVEMSQAKAGYLEPDKRNLSVTVLSEKNDVACVKLTSAIFNDYLVMVNFAGQWKIVNVLWTLGPDAPNRKPIAGFNPADERQAVESTMREYYDGVFSGDVVKLEKAIHPEMSMAQLSKVQQTGKYTVSRNGTSSLIEVARAKLRIVPEDQRQVDIKILDVMDGMALLETATANARGYFQLQLIDARWYIINTLMVPIPKA